ncbi:MAG: ubiquinol-cytochrome C chaperone [Ahrensia sp.]|nr:ubiquinol-cytochrome C chaperone [Ahrensia sp.]
MTLYSALTSFLDRFGRDRTRQALAQRLYGAVVASARDPHLFRSFEMPDTFDGRFEMLTLHLYLLNDRLKADGEPGRALSQDVFDLFIEDMDSALRELGVGDQTVPKRLSKMTRVVHGRAAAYDRARDDSENAEDKLAQVMARNVFDDRKPQSAEYATARWMLDTLSGLKEVETERLASIWPAGERNQLAESA